MAYEVIVETVEAEWIAAVRVVVPPGEVWRAWKPALEEVWDVLRRSPHMTPGHNLFLYHHPPHHPGVLGAPIEADFGVQVPHPSMRQGNVRCIEVPAGEVATALHVGPYDRLGAAHEAIRAWCAANNRHIGGASWELYGDWHEDPARLETTVRYLLT